MNDYFELFHPTRGNVPNHIGLIPDGSRRWAKSRGISYFESYEIAMAKLSQILDFLYGKGVGTVSIYFSSSQNFDRPKEEIEAFCKAESNFCSHYILPSVQKNKIKGDYCGNAQLVPGYLLDSLEELKSKTMEMTGKRLNICVAYNPFDELWQSFNSSDSPEEFLHSLWVPDPLDLVIRTGKANLISNFLPLQSGFARLYFPDKMINDLTLDDIAEILNDFSELNRKYGE